MLKKVLNQCVGNIVLLKSRHGREGLWFLSRVEKRSKQGWKTGSVDVEGSFITSRWWQVRLKSLGRAMSSLWKPLSLAKPCRTMLFGWHLFLWGFFLSALFFLVHSEHDMLFFFF